MLKNILNLKGSHLLSKSEQKNVHGGARPGSGGRCCDPAKRCCTTFDLAGNPNCGATYISGCFFIPATGCCV